MPQLHKRKPPTVAVVALGLVLIALLLAACGGSSTASKTSSNASATTSSGGSSSGSSTNPGGSSGTRRKGGFVALRACLQKNGITLPRFKAGQRPGRGKGGLLGGAPTLPRGVTRAQYEAALKKCGGFTAGRFKGSAGKGLTSSPREREALSKFAACMRENGVNLPAPNTSGKGPVFDTKGLQLSNPKFRAAETKCRPVLRSAIGGPQPGSSGSPPPAAAQ